MSNLVLTRRRTTGSFIAGGVVILIGLVILGNAVVATTLSVRFLGWMLVVAGLAGLTSALLNVRAGGSWSLAIGGGVCLVVGVMCLRNVEAAALTLTLVAGSLFLLAGLVRLIAAVGNPQHRLTLLFGGAFSTLLGLVVLLNLFTASYALLGVLLGLQTIGEGVNIVLLGGLTMTAIETERVASSAQ